MRERGFFFASPETTRGDGESVLGVRGRVGEKPISIGNNPSGIGTYRGGAGGGGGAEKRATSKYENIRVPDPFALVQKELQFITERMRAAVQTDLPALANAAEYFFKYGAEGKRMRPTVLLLMASALAPVSSGRVASGNVGRRMSSAFTSSSARSGANDCEETVDLSRRRARCRAITGRGRED